MEGDKAIVERDEAQQERPFAQEEDEAGPAAEAAASVSSRLSSIFNDPRPVVWPEAPRLVIEDEEEGAVAVFPRSAANPAFAPAPAQEELQAPEVFKESKLELVAANESEPTLSDTAAGQDTEPSEIAQDSAEDLFSDRFRAQGAKRKRKGGLGPAVVLAAAGLAVFGGSLFWAMNTPVAHAVGAPDRGLVVWLAGIVGVALIGVAVYLILDHLGRPVLESIEPGIDRDE
jgi:lysozyme